MNNTIASKYNQAIAAYQQKWAKLLPQASNQKLFQDLRPTAVGWKVADLAEYNQTVAAWREDTDQVHAKWMNGRWIAIIYLREGVHLEWGIRMLKILQRRPGSSDALGLDHIDFHSPQVAAAKTQLLTAEPNLKITDEANGSCKWLSVWFDGTEAKLRTGTSLGVCAAELLEAEREVIGGKPS